jgi:hypothetical protein
MLEAAPARYALCGLLLFSTGLFSFAVRIPVAKNIWLSHILAQSTSIKDD